MGPDQGLSEAYTGLAGLSYWGFSCLQLPSHHRRTGLQVSTPVAPVLRIDSGTWNSQIFMPVWQVLPSEPSLQLKLALQKLLFLRSSLRWRQEWPGIYGLPALTASASVLKLQMCATLCKRKFPLKTKSEVKATHI